MECADIFPDGFCTCLVEARSYHIDDTILCLWLRFALLQATIEQCGVASLELCKYLLPSSRVEAAFHPSPLPSHPICLPIYHTWLS
jgi:hypothetical protein